MGGGPVLRVEVALSCIVPSAAKGELTDTDCSSDFTLGECSLGEDISTAENYNTSTPLLAKLFSSPHGTKPALPRTDVFEDVRRCLRRCRLGPLLL